MELNKSLFIRIDFAIVKQYQYGTLTADSMALKYNNRHEGENKKDNYSISEHFLIKRLKG